MRLPRDPAATLAAMVLAERAKQVARAPYRAKARQMRAAMGLPEAEALR